MKESDIYIFYHLFTLPKWIPLWRYHLQMLRKSKLYHHCKEIRISVILTDPKEMNKLKKEIEPFTKIKIHASRFFEDIPTVIWDKPRIEINTQLGEGESILKMINFSKQKENDIYLFFHSKSITAPKKEKGRSQMKFFYELGLKRKCNPQERMKFIRNEMTKDVIGKWKDKVKGLETKDYYFCVWNFFWAKGSFLRKFNFKKFDQNGSFPQHYTLSDRHWSAMFPVTLSQVINNKKAPPLNRVRKVFKAYN